ncbi:MAG: protease complex subunit PrcB family protein [Acidobacteriota bacterium]|nr:protease complex subunit PrcB family protein [Acidobacteriota bacterium]MDH3522395.1 protease complex subunit PrcB family protein [Acidobacteriota bacterium]
MRDPRKLRRPTLLALAAILLIPACDGKSPTAPTLPEGDVPWETLFQSQESGITEFRRDVIRVQSGLEALWNELGTRSELPIVDFNVDMVLVAASGEQPNSCYDIEVTAARSDGTDLTVTVTERTPTTICVCPPVVVQPVEVIKVPRADEVFFTNITLASCAT